MLSGRTSAGAPKQCTYFIDFVLRLNPPSAGCLPVADAQLDLAQTVVAGREHQKGHGCTDDGEDHKGDEYEECHDVQTQVDGGDLRHLLCAQGTKRTIGHAVGPRTLRQDSRGVTRKRSGGGRRGSARVAH